MGFPCWDTSQDASASGGSIEGPGPGPGGAGACQAIFGTAKGVGGWMDGWIDR